MTIWKVKLHNSTDNKWYTKHIKADNGDEAGKIAFEFVKFPCDDITAEQVFNMGEDDTMPWEQAVIDADAKEYAESQRAAMEADTKMADSLNLRGWLLIISSYILMIIILKFNTISPYTPEFALVCLAFIASAFPAYFGCTAVYRACAYRGWNDMPPVLYLITPAVIAIPGMSVWNTIVGFDGEPELTTQARMAGLLALIPWAFFLVANLFMPCIQPGWRMSSDGGNGLLLNPFILGLDLLVAGFPSFVIGLIIGYKYFIIQKDIPAWYKPTFWGLFVIAAVPAIGLLIQIFGKKSENG